MKVLKATLCLIFTAVLIFPAPALSARADSVGKYAMALTEFVYLCKDTDDSTRLFAIPYTYCVEILDEYDSWYCVRYARDEDIYRPVTGYCKKDNLLILDEKPENDYLYYPLTVTLHSDSTFLNPLSGLEITVTVAYYGNRYKGTDPYSYILYGEESFAYIEGIVDDYKINPIPSDPTFSQTSGIYDESNIKFLTMAVIAALAISAIIILLITGSRKKPAIK